MYYPTFFYAILFLILNVLVIEARECNPGIDGDLYCKESIDSYGNGYVCSNVKGTNGTCIYGCRSDCDCRKGTCDKKASPRWLCTCKKDSDCYQYNASIRKDSIQKRSKCVNNRCQIP